MCVLSFWFSTAAVAFPQALTAKRLVILEIDGLNADLLYRSMGQVDPATGKPELPWFEYIFGEHGTVFDNFYTRGISLSAPSWSMLDTGRHGIIRGNVEYDRFTGEIYDYLNFFPLYLGYARNRTIDMPGVEVLTRAGIPLLIDCFGFGHSYQSFQLFQQGVRWMTLEQALKRRFSGKSLWLDVNSGGAPTLSASLLEQQEAELELNLANPGIIYLDYFTSEVDHEGHQTNDPAALLETLKGIDAVAGKIWSAIRKSPLAAQTLFAVVSDHGLNNVPGIVSETFSLPDLFNSAAGGGHHVVTDRVQMSDYKIRGLDPLVHRSITPSTASYYLKGQADRYPTAWIDMDGNERASVGLRNSDLNEIQILLERLQGSSLDPKLRSAAAATLCAVIERHRDGWRQTVEQVHEEMQALRGRIEERKKIIADLPKKWNHDDYAAGADKAARRLSEELEHWEHEEGAYTAYAATLQGLLNLQVSATKPPGVAIPRLVPELSLGERNSLRQLRNYVVALSDAGLAAGADGSLDEERSFRTVDYLEMLAHQTARNNPQPELSNNPIDFVALALPPGAYTAPSAKEERAYLLDAGASNEIMIVTDAGGRLLVLPVKQTRQDESGNVRWMPQAWRAGLPLHLFEDSDLQIPAHEDRGQWLSCWHTEREWFEAIHETRYSNGVIGIVEDFSPVGANVPGPAGISPVLLRFERRRRELVQPDIEVFAADHWNFNVRFPNPGGNHGGLLRISTHSVWMLAGAGLPVEHVAEPYDSLNFANTLLALMGRTAPMADRVVALP